VCGAVIGVHERKAYGSRTYSDIGDRMYMYLKRRTADLVDITHTVTAE
jgi:hypothetical protein